MRLGMVGLGRMGLNMTRRLLRGGHEVVAHNRSPAPIEEAVKDGAMGAQELEDVISELKTPRAVWLMVPAGSPTQSVMDKLEGLLGKGDIIIDGGNSKWKDTIERSNALSRKGIHLLDCGTSGGVWGLELGYCLMVGGDKQAFDTIEPVFKTLAPEKGYGYMGPSGSGHFVKMIHNGIEYAMLQSYGEGFEILERSEYTLDLAKIARLWNSGSVIRSWLLELAESAFDEDPKLESIAGYVEDSGEGRWTVQAAIHESVPAPAIATALFARFYSQQDESFAAKVIAALRKQFGGHAVRDAAPQEPPAGEEG
jgi:6-phosphogluconate dehydrogenase